ALSAHASEADPQLLMSCLLALTVTMMARAILIPSTAARTFCLSWIASAPLFAVSLIVHGHGAPGFVKAVIAVSTFLWLTIAVVLSTVASRIIYGLRKQVREASDIGQYTLEAKIGHGGMGEVWRARHRRLIRPAAVQLIRPPRRRSAAGCAPAM